MHGHEHRHHRGRHDADPGSRVPDAAALRRAAPLLVAALLLPACVGRLQTHHHVTGRPGPRYGGSVEVFLEGAPLPSHYDEVAMVQAHGNGANVSTLLPALQAEAAALGCNAVILVRVDQGSSHASATGVAVRTRAAP